MHAGRRQRANERLADDDLLVIVMARGVRELCAGGEGENAKLRKRHVWSRVRLVV